MRATRLIAALGGVLLVLALVGLLLTNAWYDDDACTREQYQCSLGSLGFTAALVLGPVGLLLLAVAGVMQLRSATRRRRRIPPPRP